MDADDAPQPKRCSIIRTEGPLGSWFTLRDFIFGLNEVHGDFRRFFFDRFRALLREPNHEDYVRRMVDYVRSTLSMHMFVRVERPRGSKHFVLGYVKCERVFSFIPRYEKMRLRLNRVPPRVLTDMENGENAALRLACVGETDYERALATHCNGDGVPPLVAALKAEDEESAKALLDGGDDPNEVDGDGGNALHMAAWKGCRLPLFDRIAAMILNVNAGNNRRNTALMKAAQNNRLDVVVSLMDHPGIDLNAQGRWNYTALHYAVARNHPAIVAQLLSDDRIDCSLRDNDNDTPLKCAIVLDEIVEELDECVKILREHGAPEE